MKPELIEELPEQDHIRPSWRKWRCKCGYCGNDEWYPYLHNVKSGHSTNCGCVRLTADGNSAHPLYLVWYNMIQRCHNPDYPDYEDWGGRGIKVCDRWRESFDNFVADMGERPEGHTIERVNNELGYCPENCEWATYTKQNRNKRNNRKITAFGRTQCLAAWAEETGLNYRTIWDRINRGWTPEQALATPPRCKLVENPTAPLEANKLIVQNPNQKAKH